MKTASMISVLIVETDPALRDAFRICFQSIGDITVEAVVVGLNAAIERITRRAIDVVLLDYAVADMSLIECTTRILRLNPEIGIVLTVPENDAVAAVKAVEALAAGAFDYVLKPPVTDPDAIAVLQRRIIPKIRSFSIRRYSRQALISGTGQSIPGAPEAARDAISRCKVQAGRADKLTAGYKKNAEAILIGASTGGPEALLQMLPQFPSDFPLPVVIVLHMPKSFTGAMAGALGRVSRIKVNEAADGQELLPGTACLAQGGLHLEIHRETRNRLVVHTTDAPPENGCRPAVDVLFRSAAAVLKDRAIVAVLTGMGCDGEQGAALLKEQGAFIIVQDEATSVVWGMPGSIARTGGADLILPLDAIVPEIVGRVMMP